MAQRNVTITLDEETARWARVEAAKRDTSVSRFVGDMLRERMREADDYQAAMEAFFSSPPRPRREPGPYPTREEIHDRAGLRRLERDRLHEGQLEPGQTATG